MSEENIDTSIHQVLANIKLISSEAIPQIIWSQAHHIAFDVDENDTPFLATTIGLDAILWTGDKKLINGLRAKGYQNIYSTSELYELRK